MASKAGQLGVRWKIGDGKSIRFWEDHWFGNCSLTIQFWELYTIADQKNKSIADYGETLKISFRRDVSPRLMNQWLDLVSIAESISFSDDCDSIIWAFDGSNKFSVQAIYKKIASEAFSMCIHLLFRIFVSLPVSTFSSGFYLITKL